MSEGCPAPQSRTSSRAAGIAQGTFYLYFESKDDVLLAVAEQFVASLGTNPGVGAAGCGSERSGTPEEAWFRRWAASPPARPTRPWPSCCTVRRTARCTIGSPIPSPSACSSSSRGSSARASRRARCRCGRPGGRRVVRAQRPAGRRARRDAGGRDAGCPRPRPGAGPSRPRRPGRAMTTDAVVTTRGLTKHFGRVTAVDDLDLEVRRGEIYAFLGRNGAGKTTTIRMILGLIRPMAGRGARLRRTGAVQQAGMAAPGRLPCRDRHRLPEPHRQGEPRAPPPAHRSADEGGRGRNRSTRPRGRSGPSRRPPLAGQQAAARAGSRAGPRARPPGAGRAGERPRSRGDRRDPWAPAFAGRRSRHDRIRLLPHPRRGRPPGRPDRHRPRGPPCGGAATAQPWSRQRGPSAPSS